MKNFEYKLFSLNGEYKWNFTHLVTSKISLNSQINGWLGEVKITILDDKNNFFKPSDIVKIFLYDNKNPEGKIFFSGVISEFEKKFFSIKKEVSISALSVAVFLQKWIKEKTWTWSKKDVLRAIVDDYNSIWKYNFEVEFEWEFAGNINKNSIRNTHYSNFLSELCAGIEAFWRVDASGKIIFSEKTSVKTHFLAMDGEIFEIKIEKKFDVLDFLNNRPQDKKTQITMEIRETDSFSLDEIRPWDMVKILNTDEVLDNSQIVKIAYNQDTARLEIWDLNSLFKEILDKRNE